MTRRDQDWNRPIPQRQQANAAPSRLLRSVASEHIPDTPPPLQPMSRVTMAELRAQVTRQRHDRAADSMARFTQMTTGRAQGRSSPFNYDAYQTLFNDTLRNMEVTTTNTTQAARINLNEPNWGSLNLNRGAGMASMRIQSIQLRADPPQYTFQTDLAEDAHADLNTRANRVFRNQVSRAATRIGTQIYQNIQARRDIEHGMEELTPITNTPRPPRVNVSDFDGDSINWAAGTSAILSQKHMEQPKTKEKTYTMDEIKAWLKENLEVKTQVFESDGEVSVTTTLVLDGEEISSDTDSAIL